LQTPLLPDEIIFEGPCLVKFPLLKIEEWDLAEHEKFPHLVTEQMMHCIIDTTIERTNWSYRGGSKE